MKTKFITIILSFFAFALTASAQSDAEMAKNAYDAKDFGKAVELYQKAVAKDSTRVSASLLYNLGNACFNAGDFGGAVLAYSRALKIDPSSRKIKDNLDYVLSKVEDRNAAPLKGSSISAVPDDSSLITTIEKYVSRTRHSDFWAVWALIFFCATLAGIALYIFSGRIALRKTGFFGSIATLGLCIIFLICAFLSKGASEARDECVVTAQSAVLVSEAGAEQKKNDNVVYQGTLLQILEVADDAEGLPAWYKVRLNANFIGWIKASEIEVV